MTTLCDRINADPSIAKLTQRHVDRMQSAIAGAVERADRRGEHLALPAADLSRALFAAVVGVLARSTADRKAALRLLDGVCALVPTP